MAEIVFKPKYSLGNGNKINKKNWQNIRAISTEPDITHHGYSAIDKIRIDNGAYYNLWHLKQEDEGYIFREVVTNSGINGHHKTVRKAVFTACRSHIKVYLEV